MSNEVVTVEEDTKEVSLAITAEKYEIIESDLTEIQTNLTRMSDKMITEIDMLVQLSHAAQHPKAYEALAKFIQTFTNVNREASNVIMQKKTLYDGFRETKSESSGSTLNDNRSVTMISSGKTSLELLKEYKEIMKDKPKDD